MNTPSSLDQFTVTLSVAIISFPKGGGPLGPNDYQITVTGTSGGFQYDPKTEHTSLGMSINTAGVIIQPPAGTKFLFQFNLATSGFSFVSPGLKGTLRTSPGGTEPIIWDQPSCTATSVLQSGTVTGKPVVSGKTDYGYDLLIQQNGGAAGFIDPDIEFDVTTGTVDP